MTYQTYALVSAISILAVLPSAIMADHKLDVKIQTFFEGSAPERPLLRVDVSPADPTASSRVALRERNPYQFWWWKSNILEGLGGGTQARVRVEAEKTNSRIHIILPADSFLLRRGEPHQTITIRCYDDLTLYGEFIDAAKKSLKKAQRLSASDAEEAFSEFFAAMERAAALQVSLGQAHFNTLSDGIGLLVKKAPANQGNKDRIKNWLRGACLERIETDRVGARRCLSKGIYSFSNVQDPDWHEVAVDLLTQGINENMEPNYGAGTLCDKMIKAGSNTHALDLAILFSRHLLHKDDSHPHIRWFERAIDALRNLRGGPNAENVRNKTMTLIQLVGQRLEVATTSGEVTWLNGRKEELAGSLNR